MVESLHLLCPYFTVEVILTPRDQVGRVGIILELGLGARRWSMCWVPK